MADWTYEADDFEPGGGPIVLLVEDEMIIAFDMADQLTSAGFTVDGPFPSTVKALAALSSGKPDVAILDVQLADGHVYPFAARLREMGVPIVFHSGHAAPEDLICDYPHAFVCTKPCPGDKLVTAVRGALKAPA